MLKVPMGMLGLALVAVVGLACADEPESPTPIPDRPVGATQTPAVPKSDGDPSAGAGVECAMTEIAAQEIPMLVARGVDPIPSGFDAANSGVCSFGAPVRAVTLELHRDGIEVFAQTAVIDPPANDVRFPLADAEIGPIPDALELGSYDLLITVTHVDGGLEEVHSGIDSIWLLDPESSPIDAARKALIASRQMLVESLAAPYFARLADFEPVEWPDTGLGCPEPDRLYAQVVTPGFRLQFEYQGQRHEYHTDRDGSTVVRCEVEPASAEGLPYGT